MRVLLISHTYMPRVNQPKLHELGNYPGVELRVLVPQQWREPNRFDLRPEMPAFAHFQYAALPTLFTPHINRFFFLTPDLTMRSFQPDIIQVEESEQGLSLLQALVYRRMWAPRARVVFFTWQNVSWRPKVRVFSAIERYNLAHADGGIAGNQDAAALVRQRGFRKRVSVIPQLGIDTEIFQPGDGAQKRIEQNIPLDAFVIGYASRMVAEKGAMLLLEAAARLSGNWVLILIGRGPEQTRVRRRVDELGVREHVRMLDSVAHANLPDYLRAMNVMVLPSYSTPTWKEQFAGGLLEAMACGTIAIGSTCGEIPNVLSDAGIVFPEDDAQTLADSLRHLQTDPMFRATLVQRGLERVRQQYTWSETARQTFSFWSELLSNG